MNTMPLSRRQFGAVIGAGLSTAGTKSFADDETNNPLRVIAYNVYACIGWPHNRQLAQKAVADGQMVKRMAMELALHDADIINFSESPSEGLVGEIAKLLGMNYVRFHGGGNWPGTLLSRFEIIDSQNLPLDGEPPQGLFTRHWGRGTIMLPNGEPLIVHSAHLHTTAAIRMQEVAAVLEVARADLNAGRSLLLLGDLNHAPDTEEYQRWMDAGWVDTFAKVGHEKGLTFRSDVPKWRIDYVMAAGPIADQVRESRPLFEGAFRLNIADKESFALSDHLPQLAVFQSTE